MQETLGEVLPGRNDFRVSARLPERLANHRGTWWHAKLIESWEQTMPPSVALAADYGQDNFQLRSRAVVARSVIWLPGIGRAWHSFRRRCVA